MSQIFFHERLYRSPELMESLAETPITICGAGALGANLTETLVRMGWGRVSVIDRDRVEERNLSTQPYQRSDVGTQKAKMLANTLYRAVGTKVTALCQELTAANVARLLEGAAIVVDCFDNSLARGVVTSHCLESSVPCLHVGLSADYAEVIWNEEYRVPSDAQDDLCDYPLARNLVMLAMSVAAEVLVEWRHSGERRAYTLTLRDLCLRPYI